MSSTASLRQEAVALPKEERKRMLEAIPETEFHGYLANLFRAMSSEYLVEVTHGAGELGKDLVIVRDDPLAPAVIAVVVKRGNIRAKTAGDIDAIEERVETLLTAKGRQATKEIFSQVAQAAGHDAELRSKLARLKVTKVIVVLVGAISGNVRTRIEAELAGKASLYDVAWLISEFTEHYPQVFFDGHAVDFLDAHIQRLESDAFHAKAGKTLSQCFVEPVFAQLDQNVAVNEAGLALQILRRRVRLQGLMSLLQKRSMILLVGDPGSGKSKALAKLAIDSYRKTLLSLAHSRAESAPVGIPLLVTTHQVEGWESSGALRDALLPVATRERFTLSVLLVDGLDEIPAVRRESVIAKCRKFSEELGCGLLLTSRKLASLSVAPSGFRRYELLPFELSQALKLVEKTLADVATLPALREGLQRVSNQIPMSPLSLLLLVEVVKERKEVPSSITELYDRFLDLVFGRWDQEKGLEVLFEYVIKKRFLARLSYDLFFSRGRLEIPVAEFAEYGQKFALEYGWDPSRFMDFLKELERASILDVHEEVVFRHRSFLDYFVALYLHDNRAALPDINELAARTYFDAVWSEVAFFYSGLRREVTREFMDLIFNHGSGVRDHPVEKLLAGRLLQAGWFSPTALKEDCLARCLSTAPEAGDLFRQWFAENGVEVPGLYADVFVALLTELSAGSFMLATEGRGVLKALRSAGGAEETLLKRMALLWAARKYLPPDEHRDQVLEFVGDVEGMQLSPREEARFLLLASVADGQSKQVGRAVVRRMRRLRSRAPEVIATLLPESKHGFRKRARPARKKK